MGSAVTAHRSVGPAQIQMRVVLPGAADTTEHLDTVLGVGFPTDPWARRRYKCASCSQVQPIPPSTWIQSLALARLRREQLRHQSAPRFLPARVRPDSTGPSRRTRHLVPRRPGRGRRRCPAIPMRPPSSPVRPRPSLRDRTAQLAPAGERARVAGERTAQLAPAGERARVAGERTAQLAPAGERARVAGERTAQLAPAGERARVAGEGRPIRNRCLLGRRYRLGRRHRRCPRCLRCRRCWLGRPIRNRCLLGRRYRLGRRHRRCPRCLRCRRCWRS